jgi:hypothetical protein
MEKSEEENWYFLKLQLLKALNLSQGLKAQSTHFYKIHYFVFIVMGVNDPTTSYRTINKNTFMWMWAQNFVIKERQFTSKLC